MFSRFKNFMKVILRDPVSGEELQFEDNDGSQCLPVCVQDQVTPALDLYFAQQLAAPTTLAVATAIGVTQITVSDATGFVTGDYIGVFSGVSLEGRFYFATVLSVAGPVVQLDTPLDFAFDIGDPVVRTTREMNVVGTRASPEIFSVSAGTGGSPTVFDITRIMIHIETATAVDLSTFGDLAALTNGIVLRHHNGVYNNMWNIKSNGEMQGWSFDLDIHAATNPVQGLDGLVCRMSYAGQEKHGVAIRLHADESLDILVQDDLNTIQGAALITKFRVHAQGHVVQNP